MKIKSLLLGSAAALVAVSGARAADAIVAEPEPVEYVRVCDAYGAGFYYIPGTETCLSINGYVFVEVGGASRAGNYHGFATNQYNAWLRGRVNLDARSDTEWGTLRSYIRLQSSWTPGTQTVGAIAPVAGGNVVSMPGDGNVTMDQAYIELGGFRVGYTESAFVTSQRAGVGAWGSHSWYGMSYGYQQRLLMSYTFGGNGFAATISLEDDRVNATVNPAGAAVSNDWMPDVVANASYNAGWGGVWAKVGYDESIRRYGLTAGVQLNVTNAPGSSFRLIGYYDNAAVAGTNAYGVGGRWSILASYHHQFSSTFGANVAFQYMNDLNLAAAGSPNGYQVEAEAIWTPVTNFEVRAALAYTKTTTTAGATSGFLRFTRYF